MGYCHGDTNVNPQPSRSPINVSTRGSCALEDVPENDLLDPDECELYVEDPLHVVAIGSVFNLGPTIHHKQIEDDKVRVVVKRVREANARVLVPTEEVQTVSEAPNHFILWPRRLVKLVTAKETVEPEHDPFSRLCSVALRIGKMPIQLQLDLDVIGRPTSIPFYISQRDMMDLAMGNEMVSLSTLQLWLMYLNRLCISKGIVDKYGFIDPLHIQSTGNKTKDIQSYIQSRICTVRKECYLTPYLHSEHWQLMIICPRQNCVVFLCSLGNKPKKDIRTLVDTAMEAWHMLEGRHSGSRKKTTWICPSCPTQTGGWECGYYVMRHMFNIVSTTIIDSWNEIFTSTDPFTEEEIDDVRKRLAIYLLEVSNK